MIGWLPELNRTMRNMGLPQAQTDALSLSAITVADICQRFVPHAPMPRLEQQPVEEGDLGPDLKFGWLSQRQHRALSLIATADGRVALHLLDMSVAPGRTVHDEKFTYDDLKTAVIAFFEGWVPPS